MSLDRHGQAVATVLTVATAIFLFFGLYVLALFVIIKLFEVSVWWGLVGLVAYLGKPRLNFKASR